MVLFSADAPLQRGRRRWLRAAALVILPISVLLGIAHSEPVRKRVLVIVDALLLERFGIVLDAASLHYNLLKLRAEFTGVSLSDDAGSAPFATARSVRIDFDVRTLLGSPRIGRVVLTSPRLELRSGENGWANVPSFNRDNGSQTGLLPELSTRDLDLSVVFPSAAIVMRGVTVAVNHAAEGGLKATIDARQGLGLDVAGSSLHVESAAASVLYDGRTVSLEHLTAARPGTRLSGTGTIDASESDPSLDLIVTGSLDLATWHDWFGAAASPSGALDLRAHLTGPPSNPSAAIEATGRDLRWSSLLASSAHTRGSWQDGVLTLDALTFVSGDGRVDASGTIVPDGRNAVSRLKAQWSSVPVRRLLDAAGVASSAPPLVTDGSTEWRWEGALPNVSGAAASGSIVARSTVEAIGIDFNVAQRGRRWQLTARSTDPERWDVRGDAEIVTNGAAWSDYSVLGRVASRSSDIGDLLMRLRALGLSTGDIETYVKGAASLDVSLRGTLGTPQARGDVGVTSLSWGRSPPLDARSQFTLDLSNFSSTGTFAGTIPDLGAFEWHAASGVDVRGSITFSGSWTGPLTDPSTVVDIGGRDLHVAGTALPASARTMLSDVSITAALEGRLGALKGHAHVDAESVEVGSTRVGPITADVALENDLLNTRLQVATLGTRLEATIALTAPHAFEGRGVLVDADPVWILGALGVAGDDASSSERLAASVTASGDLDRLEEGTFALEVAPVNVAVRGAPVRISEPARVTAAARRVNLQAVHLLIAGVSLNAEGTFGLDDLEGGLQLEVDGDLGGLSPWLPSTGAGREPVTLAGRIDGRLEARRSSAGLSLYGSLESSGAELRRGPDQLAANDRARIDFIGTRAVLPEMSLASHDVELGMKATMPLAWANQWLPAGWRFEDPAGGEAAALDVTASSPTSSLLRLAGLETQSDTGGDIALTARFTADRPAVEAVAGRIQFDRARVATVNADIEQAEPTVLSLAGGVLDIDVLQWRGTNSRLAASGVIGLLNPTATRVALDFDSDLALIDAILPGRVTGRLAATADLVGGHSALDLTATAKVSGANWLLPDASLLFSGWEGTFSITEDAVEFSGVEGRVNGGAVRLTGRVGLLPTAQGSLTATADNVLLNVPQGLHSRIAGGVTWRPRTSGSDPALQGSLTVTASRYTEPITRVLELTAALSSAMADEPQDSPLPPELTTTTLDIRIDVTDPVVVDNSVGSVELLPELRLVGTLGAPALTGRVSVVDDGRIQVGGRTYRLRESSLNFSPAAGLLPTLDATGETTIGDYEVVLRVTGTPSEIETTYSSTPPLGQRDLRSLVVTGRTEAADTDTDASDSFALTAASADVLGFAGKFVGLDSVRLGTADLDIASLSSSTAQHFTISKALSRNFEVTVSDNLEDGAFTWLVTWTPFAGYQFRAASVEGNELMIEFRQEVLFGPGTSAASVRSRVQPGPRIDQVVITGSPGFSEADVTRILRLNPGDRFDARRWTADRLRLEDFYVQHGYHRVHITPTRRISDRAAGNGVTLEYEIERGPLTTIDVQGGALAPTTIDAMYVAWRGIPIPEITGSEFERLARVDLVNRGYLAANVRVEFPADTPDTARAVVHVSQGTQVTRRTIAWRGNEVIASDALDTLVSAQPPDRSPWINPQAMVESIVATYARRGYFETRVDVGAATVDGDLATLEVSIVEGKPTLIGDVSVAGVTAPRRAAAIAALRLSRGTAFGTTTVEEAEDRLEAFYIALGYQDATVDVRASRRDGTATVDVNVREGAEHVVDRVDVVGVKTTAGSLVSNALALAPGQPATPAAADNTRRNLYDIGTFRRVEVSFEPTARDGSTPAPRWPVVATVLAEEPRRFQLKYGLQVSRENPFGTSVSHTNLGGSVELWDRNFLGRALNAGGTFRIDRANRTISLLLSAPRTFGRRIRTTLYAREQTEISNLENGLNVENRLRELTLEQRWRATPAVELMWSYAVDNRRLRIAQGAERLDFSGPLAGPIMSVTVDRRNSFVDSTAGWFHSSSLQLGLEPLGSVFGYYKYLLRQTQFVPLGPFTLAGSLRWGLIRGFSGTPPLEILDMFFTAGGTTSVRGYSEGFLSAVTLQPYGLRLGGTDLVVLNGEIRYPIVGWLTGAAFIDAGNTFARTVDMRRLATGAGLGVRLKTPVASLRLDLAYPTSGSFGASGPRLHFSVGQMF